MIAVFLHGLVLLISIIISKSIHADATGESSFFSQPQSIPFCTAVFSPTQLLMGSWAVLYVVQSPCSFSAYKYPLLCNICIWTFKPSPCWICSVLLTCLLSRSLGLPQLICTKHREVTCVPSLSTAALQPGDKLWWFLLFYNRTSPRVSWSFRITIRKTTHKYHYQLV